VSGALIAAGVVGLANASGTRDLYAHTTSTDPPTLGAVGADHGGVERQPCN